MKELQLHSEELCWFILAEEIACNHLGETCLHSDLLFLVTVEDVNEEGPIFDKPSYYQILLDNSTAGTLVVDINARDESKGYDEGIFYNISGMLEKMLWVFITGVLAYC